jgi:activating signal cointegrator 1
MKALSLIQPWATLWLGPKRFETRSWPTSYRGPLLVHASKGKPAWAREYWEDLLAVWGGQLPDEVRALSFDDFPRGGIIGQVQLVKVMRTEHSSVTSLHLEYNLGDFSSGRFAWDSHCPKDTDGDGNCPLHPHGCKRKLAEIFPCRGYQGIWDQPLPLVFA